MLAQAISFGVGLVALYFGAEWLVKGAARMARAKGVSALVVGLTVVAAGTSAPELVVSMVAAVREQGDVAMGNVVGSNILNIGMVLGLAALIYPLRVEMALIRRELPVMLGASTLPLVLGWDGLIERGEGALLLLAFAAYIVMTVRLARKERPRIEREFLENEDARGLDPTGEPAWRNLALIGIGLVALGLGAHLLVGAAVAIARTFGVPELIVGLTIVSIGTSLPEIAASLMAAARHEADIAMGNVVGSNIFNILLILGAAGAVQPVRVAPALLSFDIPVMIGLSALLLPLVYSGLRLERWEGAVLVFGYGAYMAAHLL